jgi:septal ring factor EnvC (AmiA/AmiB activator)
MSPASRQKNQSGFARVAAAMLVVSLGIWGCARRPVEQSNNTDRVREMEARCVKREQDYRSVAQARDKARKDLTTAEEEVARLQKELTDRETLLRERDDLRKQLAASQAEKEQVQQLVTQRTSERDELQQQVSQRTSERDVLMGRCDRLRKGLQDLLIQDDSPYTPAPAAVISPSATSESGPLLGGQS